MDGGFAIPHPSMVLERLTPRADARAPVLIDSPHSGRLYPPDFRFTCPEFLLRQAEDSFVDELAVRVPEQGATMLNALFPRSYIDVNRAIDDIDPKLLNEPWPDRMRPSDKGRLGMGLVRRLCKPGVPMYDTRLSAAAIAHRITHYYKPYHAALERELDALADDFGAVWHINIHSMPSVSASMMRARGQGRPDFVLGDRDGSTCHADFTAVVREGLESLGYRVSVNDPYKGVEIVRRHGAPELGRHSLQLEINRALYLNEETLEKTADFDRLRDDLADLAGLLARYTRDNLAAIAAD